MNTGYGTVCPQPAGLEGWQEAGRPSFVSTATSFLPQIQSHNPSEIKTIPPQKKRESDFASHGIGSFVGGVHGDVVALNKEALSLMNKGDLQASEKLLHIALQSAEIGVNHFRRDPSLLLDPNLRTQRDYWFSAFATTLSNFGSLRCRSNQLHEALQFMQDARSMEKEVFGIPSCSTLLNLSTVLLGLGELNDALSTAHECVTASENNEPILHVFALHNYAVALQSQPKSDVRQSSLPIFKKALRQAELHLGKDHATTNLIRQRCGGARHSILSTASGATEDRAPVTVKQRARVPSTVTPTKQSVKKPRLSKDNNAKSQTKRRSIKKETTSSALPLLPALGDRERARQALLRLDYGDIACNEWEGINPVLKVSECSTAEAPKEQSSVGSEDARDPQPEAEPEVRASVSVNEIPLVGNSPDVPATAECCKLTEHPIGAFSVSTDEKIYYSALGGHETFMVELSESVNRETEMSEKVLANKQDVMIANQPECSIPLPQLPSDEDGDGRASRGVSNGGTDSVRCVDSTAHTTSELQLTKRFVKSSFPGGYIDMNPISNQTQPSFFRFIRTDEAPRVEKLPRPEELTAVLSTQSTEETLSVRNENRRKRLLLGFSDSDDDIDDYMEEEEEEERGEEENENGIGGKEKAKGSREEGSGLESLKESRIDQSSGSYRAKNAFNRIIGDSPSSRRERRIKREQQEEHALRERIRKREEELARQDHFERTLAAIIQRTRNTAASKIQYTWCAWWNSIGRRRRELLNKRAEERARREKRRMALLDYEQRIALERKKREQTSTVVTSAPAVIKCGKKWLEKTACVRYVLRRKLPCEGRRENFYRSLVVKIQTVLRGFLVRKRLGEKRAARNKQRMRKLQFEPAEYAALVIQKFVRCIFARRERRRLASEFYDPIATRIQRWIRQVSQRRRALGIDKLSCWKRKYSACMIQRAWRAYLKRLSCFMERLRFKLDESRRQERHSAVLLQRVGRGFLMRRTAGVDLHRAKRVYTVMYNMEFGRDTVKKRKEVESRDVQLYVPTPLEEVNRVAEIEREKYHIGLFVECDAKRERESLVEALRLRPLDVRRRRAQEDHLCTIEVNTLRRERAARKIQREFRHWRSIRHNPYRDKTLLFMGMGNYHENFYQRRIAGLKRELEYEAGPKHYPEQTEELKAEHAQLRAELEELYSNVRTHVGPEEVRTNEERYYTEAELQRDERDVERQKHADLLAYNADTYTRRFLDEVIGVKALPVLPNQQNMKYLEDRR